MPANFSLYDEANDLSIRASKITNRETNGNADDADKICEIRLIDIICGGFIEPSACCEETNNGSEFIYDDIDGSNRLFMRLYSKFKYQMYGILKKIFIF